MLRFEGHDINSSSLCTICYPKRWKSVKDVLKASSNSLTTYTRREITKESGRDTTWNKPYRHLTLTGPRLLCNAKFGTLSMQRFLW
jgi:hypothetical protein